MTTTYRLSNEELASEYFVRATEDGSFRLSRGQCIRTYNLASHVAERIRATKVNIAEHYQEFGNLKGLKIRGKTILEAILKERETAVLEESIDPIIEVSVWDADEKDMLNQHKTDNIVRILEDN